MLLLQRFRWFLFSAIALALYGWSAAPSITGGDAGELLGASWLVGIAHPPGYPLYSMMARMFAKGVAWGEVAWRYNLFSGFCNVMAAVVLGRLIERITQSFWSGLMTAGLLCFSPLQWRYGVVTEVFGLNQWIVAGFLVQLWNYLNTSTPKNWMFLCFLAGLGVSHHHTSVMVSGPILLTLLLQALREKGPVLQRLGQALVAGVLGLSPYLYLLVAAQSVPLMAWGNTSFWGGALMHFLRQEYGTFQLGNELTGHANELFLRLAYFAKDLPLNSFFGVGILWSTLYFKKLWRSPSTPARKNSPLEFSYALRFWSWLSLLGCVSYLVVFCYLANLSLDKPLGETVQARFWLLGFLFFCAWAGLGMGKVQGWWSKIQKPLALGGITLLIGWGIATESQRKTTQFRDYAIALLNSLPSNSILFFEGDHAFGALYYAQQVLGVRKDLDILHLNFLSRPWSRRWADANYKRITLPSKGSGTYGQTGYNLQELIEANRAPGREIFVLNSIRAWDKSLAGSYRRFPWGMAEWLVPETTPTSESLPIWKDASQRFFAAFAPPWAAHWKIGELSGQVWEEILAGEYLDARHNFAVALANLVQGGIGGSEAKSLSHQALEHLEYIKPLYGRVKPAFWKNYGLIQYQLLPFEPARAAEVISAWSKYLQDKKDPDPQQPALEQILRELKKRTGT